MRLIDYFHVYEDGAVKTLENFLFESKLDPQWIGLSKLNHFENCYVMYYDFSARNNSFSIKKYPGLCLDESGQIRTAAIPKDQVALAIIHYTKQN